jgi:hypothetical protein
VQLVVTAVEELTAADCCKLLLGVQLQGLLGAVSCRVAVLSLSTAVVLRLGLRPLKLGQTPV